MQTKRPESETFNAKRGTKHLLSVITGPTVTPTRKCASGAAIGFKTTIVMSNNVAPSILWLVCGGDGQAGGGGRARGGGLLCCVV